MFEDIFETVNSGFAQALYEDYLRDPASVPAEWRVLFDRGLRGEAPSGNGATGAAETTGTRGATGAAETTGTTGATEGTEASDVSAGPRRPRPPGPPIAGTPVPSDVTPISGPALRMLENMEASLTVPTATSFRDVDVTRLSEFRTVLNRALMPKGRKLSFTHVIGWAIVRACEQYPSMYRAVVTSDGAPNLITPDAVNFGLAVDMQRKDGSRGLLVPVIKRANRLTFSEYHAEYERLVAGARDGKLLPDAYQGGTITLTNPGTLGTVASVPRLMQGQGSIIATGAIRDVVGRQLMTISSTYDHRIIQGAESGLFLQAVDQLLQGEHRFFEEIAEEFGIEWVRAAAPGPAPGVAAPAPAVVAGVGVDTLAYVAAASHLVGTFRTHGYLAAQLDPLGVPPKGDPNLDPANVGLTPEIMRAIPVGVLTTYVGGETMADVVPRLRETYCGTIAYEIEHIANHEERSWLRRVIESGEHFLPLSDDDKRQLLADITRVDVLEGFLHKSYLGHKRFGIEGLDMLVPMLRRAIDLSYEQGTRAIVMGMAHRGRLNVLAHILGVSYEVLLAEFEGGRAVEETLTPRGGTGDVKYHHGADGTFTTPRGDSLTVTLMPNPSHLEAVDPVVEGFARAHQTDRTGADALHEPCCVLPILIHGDAAFAAQGIVAETLNLSKLGGYGTGGTFHIITNNQIGFTTDPKDARSTDFASDLAKGFDVPIVHVNADDPEACVAAVNLAMMYRKKFAADVVINLVGYRRHGHNEGDEPRYTQPLMYQAIDDHPTVRELYARRLVDLGVMTPEHVTSVADGVHERLVQTQDALREDLRDGEWDGAEPDRVTGMFVAVTEPETAVPDALLRELNAELYRVPNGFTLNRKLVKQFRQHGELEPSSPIDWAHAEALAIASLRVDGVPIRLTGQDTRRGTFSQRHLVLHDVRTGTEHVPIQQLAKAKAPIELYDSPLSEYAALGFEYGYGIADPRALVIWEAQFGDFANGAEIIIDQFIIAGLSKWGQTSRVTMLLPHGYEGQGPEHSSARVERYLALAVEGNIRVADCSTPAQYFHLLRRQGLHGEIRPLVVFTPKSLLRHPRAVSTLGDLTTGTFAHALDDPALPGPRDGVTRLVLCSGKVYYDIVMDERRDAARQVAIGRVEMLYPFPSGEVEALVARYPKLREIVWVQEEPQNMGARKWVVPQLEALAPEGVGVRFVCRPERSSPAEGYPAAHKAEQLRIVTETLG